MEESPAAGWQAGGADERDGEDEEIDGAEERVTGDERVIGGRGWDARGAVELSPW